MDAATTRWQRDGGSYNASGARLEPIAETVGGVPVARTGHALNHAQDVPVIHVSGRRLVRDGRGQSPATVVTAYGAPARVTYPADTMLAEWYPGGVIERPVLWTATVWWPSRYDASARSAMGALGAYRSVEPTDRIEAAVREAAGHCAVAS